MKNAPTSLPVESIPVFKSRSLARIYTELESLKVKHTRIINGLAVTRWADHVYEVGTFGRSSCDCHKAADLIAAEDSNLIHTP